MFVVYGAMEGLCTVIVWFLCVSRDFTRKPDLNTPRHTTLFYLEICGQRTHRSVCAASLSTLCSRPIESADTTEFIIV